MSDRDDDNTDNYLGVEGDVYNRGTGLNWLEGGRLEHLVDLLEERNTLSSQTCLAMLDASRSTDGWSTSRWPASSAVHQRNCRAATGS